jgi:hypothetical protein
MQYCRMCLFYVYGTGACVCMCGCGTQVHWLRVLLDEGHMLASAAPTSRLQVRPLSQPLSDRPLTIDSPLVIDR